MGTTGTTHQTHPVGFGAVAATYPARTAVVDPDGTQVTFGELAARCHQLSHALRAEGLVPGDCVVAMTPNRRAYYELRLAAGQIGLYLTPVSHHLTAPEIAYLVTDSEAKAVFVDASLLKAAGPALDEAGFADEGRFVIGGGEGGGGPWRDYEELLAGHPVTPPPDVTAGDVMGYTSGTTGRPKGVRKPLSGRPPEVTPFVRDFMARLDIRPGPGVHLVVSPLYHAAPGTFSSIALSFGHTVVVAERPDAEQILRLVERHRVNVLFTVPTMLHRIVRLPESVRNRYDTSSLRSVVHAGAPCPVEVKRRAIDCLGPVLTEFYGATEGSATALTTAEWLTKPGSVGYPLAGSELRIVDVEGRPLPAGETGTVYFRLPAPFEYFKDPAKTSGALLDGFFSAGDVGYVDEDGWLYLCDRRTDLILSGGVNIYPAEIEEVLLLSPEVADVAVIGVPDEEWGRRVVAVVQPEADVTPGAGLADRLIENCRSRLAGFKVPRRIEFTQRLPRTPSGKMLRREVRDRYANP
ncbi:acyl-CoA synthetase [Streptomyces antnestii]|uniref:Acyl-CoA synthetase n=1 Tax=Streptomyces antnestii TaxID=2494256 RepID=A0A3S2WM83_9ACTN|nr:AMP-binding protein [Streptomyces sp. San01]RVU28066.1 acyl-CoA synthetase [Streptomyces sp. San01]